ncbi:S-adenosylmethionine:tRNA ribosyltransferase-isomerase [Puteibacter caeruleilacunae]|nr:S-adenosylmethionine:tRNA ribosyltransferase-isomerase [Puteibacter caeruleilacunae]
MQLAEEIRNIGIEEFDYHLPEERIAKYPLAQRDQSKLLISKDGQIVDAKFTDISKYLPSDSLLVFNNTKVIRARLHFKKTTGAKIEIFCLDPVEPIDYALAFASTKSCSWKCIVGNLKKWKDGPLIKEVTLNNESILVQAHLVEREGKSVTVRFTWDGDHSFSEVMETGGIIPIPPYLNRESEQSDTERYQTVYSKIKGSVAAPTAGLHFTDKVFETFKSKNIERAELTLHVGAGTFQPVKSETIEGHEMHTEHILVDQAFIETLISKIDQVIAVGTTSIRTLESLYWMGIKILQSPEISMSELLVNQWDPYLAEITIPAKESLSALLNYMKENGLPHISSATQIIILPGYQFRIISGMITNFHQPQSTLLLLISAFLGDHWKTIYKHALEQDYRFLSYGDSNLYLKE